MQPNVRQSMVKILHLQYARNHGNGDAFSACRKISEGFIRKCELAENTFFDQKNTMCCCFSKRTAPEVENLRGCIFWLVKEWMSHSLFSRQLRRLVPHTRQPRILASYSDAELKDPKTLWSQIQQLQSPAGISTYLTYAAAQSKFYGNAGCRNSSLRGGQKPKMY